MSVAHYVAVILLIILFPLAVIGTLLLLPLWFLLVPIIVCWVLIALVLAENRYTFRRYRKVSSFKFYMFARGTNDAAMSAGVPVDGTTFVFFIAVSRVLVKPYFPKQGN